MIGWLAQFVVKEDKAEKSPATLDAIPTQPSRKMAKTCHVSLSQLNDIIQTDIKYF